MKVKKIAISDASTTGFCGNSKLGDVSENSFSLEEFP